MSAFFKLPILINALLFQALWLAAVIGSAHSVLWPSLLLTVMLLCWQLPMSRRHPTDLRVLTAAIIMGLIIDSAWVQLGFLEFTDQRPLPSLSPLWIIALWAGLALTINHSMLWLKNHPLLPPLMGLISAPLSYYAGQRLGAVTYLIDPLLFSACLGVTWAIALSILVRLSNDIKTKEADSLLSPLKL